MPARASRSSTTPPAPTTRISKPGEPTDHEIIAAIRAHNKAKAEQEAAYKIMMQARTRLVDVLRRAGVTGFTSL
jgi:hypothetical protein